MAFRLRPRGSARGAAPEAPAEEAARPGPEMFSGTTIEPEEGAASRIDDAGDVDPNFKRYGVVGGPGGAGGYGGAGTK